MTVEVEPVRDGWVVQVLGLPQSHYPSKRAAVDAAEDLADRRHAPLVVHHRDGGQTRTDKYCLSNGFRG